MGFVEVMKSFVLSPSEETLAPLQAEIMAAANYDPLVLFESVVSPLVDSGNHQGARLALDTLTCSGDGTQDAPYQVLRVSDEYDVLRYVQRTSVAQRVVVVDGQGYDVHQCSDGSEVWFKLLWQTS